MKASYTLTVCSVIALAETHLGKGSMPTSARICLDDARKFLDFGDNVSAKRRALKSLSYSVGILHPDYIAAAK